MNSYRLIICQIQIINIKNCVYLICQTNVENTWKNNKKWLTNDDLVHARLGRLRGHIEPKWSEHCERRIQFRHDLKLLFVSISIQFIYYRQIHYSIINFTIEKINSSIHFILMMMRTSDSVLLIREISLSRWEEGYQVGILHEVHVDLSRAQKVLERAVVVVPRELKYDVYC